MNATRIRMIAQRVVLQFRRDHRTMGLLFVVPIVMITLFAVLIRSSSAQVALGVVNEDAGIVGGAGAGSVFVTAIKANERVTASEMSRAEAEQALKDGRIKAAVVLGQDLTRTLIAERKLHIELLLEGSNPTDTMAVMQALSQTAQRAIDMASSPLRLSGGPAIDIATRYLYGGPEFDSLDLFAPAYIPFFVFFFVFLLTSVSFLRERMQGTLERLMATPAGRGEIVVGYTLGFGVFALVQSLVILLWSVYVLDITYVGNLAVIFLVEAVLTVVAVGMGIFLSIFARNELQAIQFIPIVILPQALLSGLIWPIHDMPNWLQPFAYVMPLTYGLRALRDVMVKGFGVMQIAPDVTLLVILGIVMLVLAAGSLRREIA
jgi:ABC-2 type transport system permease protein